jgi:lysophospholipase L1-like esterase
MKKLIASTSYSILTSQCRRRAALIAVAFGFSLIGIVHAENQPVLRDPTIPLAPGEVPDAKPAPTKKEPTDPYQTILDDPSLPRVLLMGDSVSIAYSPIVRRELVGMANVHRLPANGGATKTALADSGLSRWLKEGEKWDVIVFNHGLHDASYRFANNLDKDQDGRYASPALGCKPYVSIEDYEKNLHAIVAILRKTGAKLIFATTTPIPNSLAEKYVENSELPYNKVANRVMQQENVLTVDLWSVVKPDQEKLQIPRNVHFHTVGSEVLGKAVAAAIRPVLP